MGDNQVTVYDPNTIAHFRGVLLAKRVEIMARAEKNNHPAFVEELNGAEFGDKPQVIQKHKNEKEREEQDLKDVESALQRCGGGIYGTCKDCGELIQLDRLKAILTASRCVSCQKKHGSQNSLHEVKTNQVSGYNPKRIFAKRGG